MCYRLARKQGEGQLSWTYKQSTHSFIIIRYMPVIWIKTNICINRTKACNLTSCKYGFLPLKTGGNVAWFGFQESWMEVVQEPQTIWWERNKMETNTEPDEPKRRTGNFECDKVNESTGHGCIVTLAATNDYFHYALLHQLILWTNQIASILLNIKKCLSIPNINT